ncbi:MAG: gliding motility-associated C-terminal domain-containing protein [Cryomorphaceae bacterium]
MANNEHNIEDIFREAFSAHEMDVSPKVWAGIEASLAELGGASTAAAGGASFIAKAAAVVGFAGLITAATIAEINYQTTPDPSISKEITVDHSPVSHAKSATSSQASSERIGQPTTETTAAEAVMAESNVVKSDREVGPSPVETTASQDKETGQTEVHANQVDAGGADLPVADGAVADKQAEKDERVQRADDSSNEEKAKKEVQSNNETAQVDGQAETPSASTTAYFTHEARQMITPNGDPFNEYLAIEGFGVKEFFIQIATQSGTIVFESNDINVRWNGIDRFGNALPNGVYFYEIRAIGEDDLPYTAQNARGSVTIKR